jgi:hypothetical protein
MCLDYDNWDFRPSSKLSNARMKTNQKVENFLVEKEVYKLNFEEALLR